MRFKHTCFPLFHHSAAQQKQPGGFLRHLNWKSRGGLCSVRGNQPSAHELFWHIVYLSWVSKTAYKNTVNTVKAMSTYSSLQFYKQLTLSKANLVI